MRKPSKPRPELRRHAAVRQKTKKETGRLTTAERYKHRERKLTSKDKNRLNRIQIGGGRTWSMKELPLKRAQVKSLTVLTSRSWIKLKKGAGTRFLLPFIDYQGKFTGENLYSAVMEPQSFLSTVIATVFRRFKFWILRHNKDSLREFNKRQNLVLRFAALCVLTKNNYLTDRFLFLSKNFGRNRKAISSIAHNFSKKLDDNIWFVYGHVCLQTQWLTSRALRPRDKSSFRNKGLFIQESDNRNLSEDPNQQYTYVWEAAMAVSHI